MSVSSMAEAVRCIKYIQTRNIQNIVEGTRGEVIFRISKNTGYYSSLEYTIQIFFLTGKAIAEIIFSVFF